MRLSSKTIWHTTDSTVIGRFGSSPACETTICAAAGMNEKRANKANATRNMTRSPKDSWTLASQLILLSRPLIVCWWTREGDRINKLSAMDRTLPRWLRQECVESSSGRNGSKADGRFGSDLDGRFERKPRVVRLASARLTTKLVAVL